MDINLLSLSTTPSDHECKDGDLSAVLGVINEDGALHMIATPKVVGAISLNDKSGKSFGYTLKDTKFYIHKVDNDSVAVDDHENCIAIVSGSSGNHVLWCDDLYADTQVWQEIASLADFQVNALAFTGRIVSVVGNTETKWITWSGTDYKVYDKSMFAYTAYIYSASEATENYIGYCDVSASASNYIDKDGNVIQEPSSSTTAYGLSKQGVAYFLEHADATVQQAIENGKYLHKYTSFGFCALRMYDGTYLAISDMFCIGPKYMTSGMNYYQGDDKLYANIYAALHKHKVAIHMTNIDDVKDLILGVDIFLCAPQLYKQTDKAIKFMRETVDPWGGGGKAYAQFSALDTQETTDIIDTNTYHRQLRIETHDIKSSTPVEADAKYIPSYDETSTPLTLEDFGNSRYGANVAHSYNGRVNIANVVKSDNPATTGTIRQVWTSGYYDAGSNYLLWNGRTYPITSSTVQPLTADIIYAIHISRNNQPQTVYMRNTSIQWPLPPVVMFPLTDIKSVDIYINCGTAWGVWYAEGVPTHTSTTGNWSYLTYDKFNPLYMTTPTYISGTQYAHTFFKTDEQGTRFHEAASQWYNGNRTVMARNRNSIYSSESGNPFVTKATTQVTVGDGTVLALQAPTRAISQGQAGSTPLVAFTSEGIYPLYVDSSSGLFSATQPGPRDVIIKGDDGYNTDAVVSIDNAILFPTDRGLMMYAGDSTSCLTESLYSNVNDVTLPNLAKILYACGVSNPGENNISALTINESLRDYLKTCRICYDYTSQRIWLCQPTTVAFSLVYSLRSAAWSMALSSLRQNLNSYPNALAVSRNGNIVNIYNSAPQEQTFFAITRPVGFGDPHTLKRVSQSVVRGLFHKGKVQCAMWGSRDMYNWYLLTTSRNHYIRGRHGSPYKYYRYLIAGKITNEESISSISAEVSASLNNQLR